MSQQAGNHDLPFVQDPLPPVYRQGIVHEQELWEKVLNVEKFSIYHFYQKTTRTVLATLQNQEGYT